MNYSFEELRAIARVGLSRELWDKVLSATGVTDVYSTLAAEVFKIEVDQVTAEQRLAVKTEAFYLAYGGSVPSLNTIVQADASAKLMESFTGGVDLKGIRMLLGMSEVEWRVLIRGKIDSSMREE